MNEIPALRRRLVTAIAAATAIGASTLCYPAVANADIVNGYDNDEYENCMTKNAWVQVTHSHDLFAYCCELFGGVWNEQNWSCNPPADNRQGIREVPADIGPAVPVTQAPLHPI